MKYALLDRSSRLRRVIDFLDDGRPHSTMEIIQGADVCAVSAIISELRANHIPVECSRVREPSGMRWYHRLQKVG